MQALVFTLAAPMMAFGEIAVDERRGTASRPTRSAVIGLLAAALGIPRTDPRQVALAEGYDIAVRTDLPGRLLADYHTVQVPPASAVSRTAKSAGRRPATRAEELAVGDLGTKLTRRDYLTDAAFTVLIVARDGAPVPVEDLASALERPAWRLSAGRRSCPLGLPPAPRVVEAATVVEAFMAYDLAEEAIPERAALKSLFRKDRPVDATAPAPTPIAADIGLAPVLGFTPSRRETRRDAVADRRRWQFAPRVELVGQAVATGDRTR
ncbi:type I-E CRISPR-associated protein Cas5/CasD [Rhodoplanes roseus]|uniref:Type I-E CRISPR-associated protein Cas5/CasD n=1 Tax=Rhodoplanes roseus TaxID=29409 RepID=A0A327KWQ5_9BRAD|nr:type I-E CRISPR-associated protein Cas5/CasD [Rhodoplanes roseus]RAI42741.1 type I-E CRISPR-associated protein Cas5/CasD [Rhodoplanes roseus]